MSAAAVLCLLVLGAFVLFCMGFTVAALLCAAKRGDDDT